MNTDDQCTPSELSVKIADEWLDSHRKSDTWRIVDMLRDEVVRLAAHDARVRRDAAREVGQYIERLHPNGLTAKKSVLADIDIAADRMGRGIHANGRDRETP